MRRFAVVVLCLLLTSVLDLAVGQPVCLTLKETDEQLRNACGEGNFLMDGTVVLIMQDLDPAGIGPEDAPVPVCLNPPDCLDGPPRTFNFNSFVVNGENEGLLPGQFIVNGFCASQMCPLPDRLYLRINLPGRHYVSQVFPYCNDGQWWGREVEMGPWRCINDLASCAPYPPERVVILTPDHPIPGPQDDGACLNVCHEFPTVMISVGPLGSDQETAAARRPHVFTGAGCDCAYSANGYSFDGGFDGPWVLTAINGLYYYQQPIVLPGNGSEGCLYAHLDFLLPVELRSVSIIPSDAAVSVDWATASEGGLNRFEIRRDEEVIAHVAAANSSTGHAYRYVDSSVLNGTTYTYELSVVSAEGARTVLATETVTPRAANTIASFALHGNYPNPFNPSTTIRFDLKDATTVTLKVYNLNGEEVGTLANGLMNAGSHEVRFDAAALPSGMYVCELNTSAGFHAAQKMVLMK